MSMEIGISLEEREKIRARYFPQAQQIIPGLTKDQFRDLENLFHQELYELND
jgi:hypothetical protein